MSLERRTMAWRNVGRLSIAVHTDRGPNQQEWDQYLKEMRDLGDLSGRKVLVVSSGGGPNGRQRQQLVASVGTQQAPVAVVSSSAIVRGIGTAVSWFNRLLRVFAPADKQRAYAYLELTPAECQRATELIAQMHAELAGQETDVAAG